MGNPALPSDSAAPASPELPADSAAPASLEFGRVVVIGNSFAGLLTAKVLSAYAESVTIVDRDRIPDGPVHRAGAPQGRQIHVVLASGQRTLEAMLPGVLDELAALGVPAVELPTDVIQMNKGRWTRRRPGGLPFLTGTRPLVEHVVRRRVLADERIDVVEATEAVGLDGDARRVHGVLVRPRGSAAAEPSVLPADLVVDASGRGSRTPHWLRSIGARSPAEERVETGVAYATRVYRARLDPAVADYRGIYLLPHPSVARGAVVMPIEEPDHYLVTLTGPAGDEPPTDPAGFEAFAARLEHPIVSEWLAAAQAQGPAMGFRSTATVRRRYDRLDGPEGLLVVGDASASFNPVYGQGVSVAALGADAVRRTLAKGRRSTRDLQKAVVDAGEQAWAVSSGVDKTLPGATSVGIRTTPADRVAGWYLNRVEAHSLSNPVVGDAFLEVIHLVAPATSLFAWPVLRSVLFGRLPPPLAGPTLLAGAAPTPDPPAPRPR